MNPASRNLVNGLEIYGIDIRKDVENMNRWFREIANDNTKGIYERFIAHILDSLTEGDPELEPHVNSIDVMGFISELVDDDELWTPVDDYLINRLKEKIEEVK